MRLYLVQHGEAQPENIDPQRHLTEQGQQAVQKVAEFLRPLSLSVSAIWHSGKPRAQQTAEILSRSISAGQGVVQRSGLSPNDPVQPVQTAVEQLGADLKIVGHLPLLSRLASSLLAGREDAEVVGFQYGGVVCLERKDGGWKLGWMIVPGLLR